MARIRTLERATLKVFLSPGSMGWFRSTGWLIRVSEDDGLFATAMGYGSAKVRFGICRRTENGNWYVSQYIQATTQEAFELSLGDEEFFIFSEMLAGMNEWIVNSGELGYSSNVIDPDAAWCALDWHAPHTHGLRIASA